MIKKNLGRMSSIPKLNRLICLVSLVAILPIRAEYLHLPLEKRLIQQGLVDVRQLDSTILVELKYAESTNFMKTNVYGDLRRCYLRPAAAHKLVKASEYLRAHNPGVRLLVVDGVRPRQVSRRMWDAVAGTPMRRYVANPRWGSMHNYGCAVDLTLVDSTGERLDMGTPMDHFGPLAQPVLENHYLKNKKITPQQVANRAILRDAMKAAGFHPIAIEWWHFNAFEKDYIRKNYTIIE